MFEKVPNFYPVVFVVLLIVWGAAYIIGMVRGQPNADHSRRLARPAKFVMIAVTLVCGGLWWLGHAAGTPAACFAALIVAGLSAGAIGDLFLADVFPVRPPESPALLFFGIGHLLYIGASLTVRHMLGLAQIIPAVAAGVIGVVIGAVGWAVLVRNPGGDRRLNVATLVYGLLLSAAVAVAVGLWAETGAMFILALGLLLFGISDLILAQYLVRRRGFRYIRDVVWIIYSAGQMLIAFSIWFAAVSG